MLGDDPGQLAAQTASESVFVQHDDFARLLGRSQDRLAVERDKRAQIQYLHADALAGRTLGGLQRDMNHPAVGDDRDVGSFATDVGLADGNGVVLGGQFLLDRAVEVFVLEVNHRVVVADRRLDQALGVIGRRWLHHLEARRVHVGHFDVLRMERAAVDVAAGGSADDQGDGLAPAVAALGREVRDLVEAAGHEICELHLEHRAQSVDSGTRARADDARLGEWRVHHAQLAKAFQHALGDLEGTAVDRDVLAHHEDRVVPFHLLPDALADCFDIGGLCHG